MKLRGEPEAAVRCGVCLKVWWAWDVTQRGSCPSCLAGRFNSVQRVGWTDKVRLFFRYHLRPLLRRRYAEAHRTSE